MLSKTTNIYLTSYFLASSLMGPGSLTWLPSGPWGSALFQQVLVSIYAPIPLLDLLFSSTLGLSELKQRVFHFSVLAQKLLRWNHKHKIHLRDSNLSIPKIQFLFGEIKSSISWTYRPWQWVLSQSQY